LIDMAGGEIGIVIDARDMIGRGVAATLLVDDRSVPDEFTR